MALRVHPVGMCFLHSDVEVVRGVPCNVLRAGHQASIIAVLVVAHVVAPAEASRFQKKNGVDVVQA